MHVLAMYISSKDMIHHLCEKHCVLPLSSVESTLLPVRGEDSYLNSLPAPSKQQGHVTEITSHAPLYVPKAGIVHA